MELIKEQEKKLATLKTQNEHIECEKHELLDLIRNLEEQLSGCNKEKEKLLEQCKTLENNFKKQLIKRDEEISALKQSNESYKSDAAVKSKALDDMKKELTDCQKKLETFQNQSSAINKEPVRVRTKEFSSNYIIEKTPEEMLKLGKKYYEGKEVEKNYNEAVKWFKKAAEKENAEAQYYLGKCYYNGQGVKKDYAEAVKWFKLAAEKGEILAKERLTEWKLKKYL